MLWICKKNHFLEVAQAEPPDKSKFKPTLLSCGTFFKQKYSSISISAVIFLYLFTSEFAVSNVFQQGSHFPEQPNVALKGHPAPPKRDGQSFGVCLVAPRNHFHSHFSEQPDAATSLCSLLQEGSGRHCIPARLGHSKKYPLQVWNAGLALLGRASCWRQEVTWCSYKA